MRMLVRRRGLCVSMECSAFMVKLKRVVANFCTRKMAAVTTMPMTESAAAKLWFIDVSPT